jgi:hypothetical protein
MEEKLKTCFLMNHSVSTLILKNILLSIENIYFINQLKLKQKTNT